MRRWLAVFLLALLPGLQGCIVFSLTGRHIADEANRLSLRLGGYGQLSTCEATAAPTAAIAPMTTNFVCATRLTDLESESSDSDIESSFGIESLADLLFVSLIDPVIIQVPAGYGQVAGTWYSDNQPLAIQSGLASVEVQPGVFLTAEPGHELVIVDFPAGPLNELKQYDVSIGRPTPGGTPAPVDVKAMLTAKVEAGGRTYYLPVLPCVRDFASIPAITIPANDIGQDLVPQILQALAQGPKGCRGTVYGFTPTTTTLPPSAETCGNCLDDDGDGLTDFDDPQCCGGGAGALTLARTRIAPKSTRSKVSLGATLGTVDGFGSGPSPEVQLQVGEPGGPTRWCAHVPADRLKGKKLSRKFRDRAGTLAGAQGLQQLLLKGRKRDGSVKLTAKANQAALQTPKPGPVGVTVGLWAANASPATARCRSTIATFRTHKKGAVRFP
jgi:hypothetical protein